MADKFAGQIPLPEAGEGFTLQVRLPAMAALESEFGEFVFIDKLIFALPRLSPKCLQMFLDHCVYNAEGKHVKAEWPVSEPWEKLAEKCLDALAYASRGKSHEQWVADIQTAEAGKENPTNGTEA